MQRSFSNAVYSAPNMHPGLSQTSSQPLASKPSNSQRSGYPTGGSVSRSEAGVSVDLSAASNTAAQGEDPMEGVRGIVSGGVFDSRPVQRAKSREAEKWFEDSNRNASTRGNVSFVDDDPPFHLPSQMPNDDSPHGLPMRASGILHHPSALPVQSLESSNSDEFRSVIDDLTIENKKLKKENIQLKRRHITHSHPDRLFEVRMHGLDAKEKKQLMQMLRQFNDSLSLSHGNSPRTSGRKRSKKGSNKPSSSSTLHSNSNLVDSAYASGSTSGHASGTPQQMAESRTAGQSDMARRSRGADKDQNVRSYLKNMSKGLLPKQPVAMTEKARKKLVVRKLEELYTGKPNTTKKNSQSAQQQLISTEAANESKHQSEAKGQSVPTEGSREAVILPVDTDVPNLQHESSFSTQSDGATIGTPDQRPTRPLDLDMSKAQNPAENIAYIRHLGFKPSEKIISGQVQAGGGNASGIWVPLNLLMNLAQLHTLNVTTEFVRQAIKEISVRFELTSDESKVRWKGGTEGTRMIGESASSAGSNDNSPTEGSQDVHGARQRSPSRSRSSKPSNSEQTTGGIKSGGDTASGTKDTSRDMSLSTGFTSSGNAARGKRPLFLSSTSREDSISYQPIFLHGAHSEEENDHFLDENDSLTSSGIREDTTGSGSGQRTKRLVSVPKEDGPVIFYHGARFCTDLSGDHDIVPVNNTRYMRATTNVIGLDHIEGVGISETKSLLNASEIIRRHAVIEEPEAPPIRVIDGRSPVFISAESILAEPYVFMATGMYDTLLSNNIMLWAHHRQVIQRRSKPVFNRCQKFLRTKLLGSDMLNRIGFSERLAVMLKPEGCETRELPPSEVPSPGFYNQWSSSESANGLSDLDDEDDSKSEEAQAIEAPGILPTFGNTALGSHSGEGEYSEDEEDKEDGVIDEDDMDEEVDMLAFEREQNADEIARREREWEEQLKDDVSDSHSDGKRSSAATVGDRSFLSEEDGLSPGRISAGAVAGQKRERDEQAPPYDGSPAKRLESDRSRNSRR